MMRANRFQFMICILLTIFTSAEAQISNIKQNSKTNKTNRETVKSDDNGNSKSDNSSGFDVGGCLSLFFDIFQGCVVPAIESLPETNNEYSQNERISDIPMTKIEENKANENVDENPIPEKIPEMPDNNQNLVIGTETGNIKDTSVNMKEPLDISLDIHANFASGIEFLSQKNYTYYDFLPEARLNLRWFLIDFRYNVLTEYSKSTDDAFKTWDLLFLLRFRSGVNSKIIIGSGLYKETFSSLVFNEHFFGLRTDFRENVDFMDITGKLAIDYTTSKCPFTEFGIFYNRRFMNFEKLYGYVSIGGMYQNYYSSTDIWAIRVGVNFNWH